MTTNFDLEVSLRNEQGTGASRRLRRQQNLVPAILYGGKEKPTMLSIPHNKLIKATENEAFLSHIINLKIANKNQQAVLKSVQRHPYKPEILHVDFQRVTANEVITMNVPLHFLNEAQCPAAKSNAIITHHALNVEVRCQAKDLPEFIEVDVAGLQMEQILHLSDLILPQNVVLTALLQGEKTRDLPVVSAHKPKGATEVTEEVSEGQDKK